MIRQGFSKLREAVDNPMPISRRNRQMFAGIYFAVGAVFMFIAYQGAADKTFRIEAKGVKQQAMKAVDSAADFGRVILDADGRIISWNRGMTHLTGRTSKEMVGKMLTSLAVSEESAETIDRLLKGASGLNYANIELPRNDNPDSTALVRMQVREVSGQPGTFRFVAVDPVGQINAVTP